MRDQGVRLSNTEKAKHKMKHGYLLFFHFSFLKWKGQQWHTRTDCFQLAEQGEKAVCTVYAEETFGCCGGCAVCGAVRGAVVTGGCCWLRPAGVDSCDSWSLFERDFNSAFSRSSVEFFSINSFICSFRTSTSSLTAYIRWLLTRS